MGNIMLRKLPAVIWLILTLCLPASAADDSVAGPELDLLRRELLQPLRAIAADRGLIAAVRAQNSRHMLLTGAEIAGLRLQWQAEQGQRGKPLIAQTIHGEAAQLLKAAAAASRIEFDAVYVTDNRDLLVAATALAPDYRSPAAQIWQRTFLAGPRDVVLSVAPGDGWEEEGLKLFASVGIVDPQSGDVIGAVTAMIPPSVLPAPSAADQQGDQFEVRRPQELVHGMNGEDLVIPVQENADVAGEGARIAGHQRQPADP